MMLKKRWFSLLVTAGLLSFAGQSAFADTTDSSSTDASAASTEQMLQKMSAQTAALEAQMNQLKKQIRELKAQEKLVHQQALPVANASTTLPQTAQSSSKQTVTSNSGEQSPVDYITGSPIVIAPYVGDHTAFNASDLVINYTSYNEDLRILQLRQQILDQFTQAGQTQPIGPLLMMSGEIVPTADYATAYHGSHNSRVDLPTAEVDLIPVINQWVNGFLGLKYDNSQLPNTPLTSNSRLYIEQGFATFGNLNQFPLYLTAGQFYVPFGTYSSNMITSPLTQIAFQTRERALLLGYESANGKGPYAELYAFNGDANTNHSDNIDDGGANLGFIINHNTVSADFGIGAIADIADSLGMQANGAVATSAVPNFTGFSSTTSPTAPTVDILSRQVPGISPHLNFSVGNFGINSEYVAATSSFDPQDMTFNGAPARPQAMNAEAYYNFNVFDKPSAFTIGYGESWQALALNIPEQRYIAAFTTSVWRDTIEELEFRHDINYGNHDSASGSGVYLPASSIGGFSNTVTLQLGVYF